MADNVVCFYTKESKRWDIRIDKPRAGPTFKTHVHVKRKKGCNGAYSWNVDGTRHDKHKFPVSERHLARAKELASQALGIPVGTLQLLTFSTGGFRVTISSIDEIERKRTLLSTYIRQEEFVIIFGSIGGLMVVFISNV
jgi:hypothetical protein